LIIQGDLGMIIDVVRRKLCLSTM